MPQVSGEAGGVESNLIRSKKLDLLAGDISGSASGTVNGAGSRGMSTVRMQGLPLGEGVWPKNLARTSAGVIRYSGVAVWKR